MSYFLQMIASSTLEPSLKFYTRGGAGAAAPGAGKAVWYPKRAGVRRREKAPHSGKKLGITIPED
jgi:hypothetical protein